MKQYDTVIALAKTQIGYHETGKNHNKYAEEIDKEFPDFYNGRKSWAGGGADWCDIFVDWLFLKCFGESETLKMLYQPRKSAGAGCKYSANYYRCHNAWGSTPKLGSQIFFGKKGAEYHTGIVIAYNGTYVTTIEGNKSDSVKQCSYKVGDSKIAGYGYPKYDEKPESHTYPGVYPTLPARGYFKKVDKGFNVRRLQEYLKWYDPAFLPRYGVDGSYGNEVTAAVMAFQQREGLKVDGLFGKASLAKAKTVRR